MKCELTRGWSRPVSRRRGVHRFERRLKGLLRRNSSMSQHSPTHLRWAALAALVLMMTACAWQSEAIKIGPDLYQTSANASPARGGGTGAREMALTNANKKCEAMGKQIEVTDIKTEYAFPANAVVTVTFLCR